MPQSARARTATRANSRPSSRATCSGVRPTWLSGTIGRSDSSAATAASRPVAASFAFADSASARARPPRRSDEKSRTLNEARGGCANRSGFASNQAFSSAGAGAASLRELLHHQFHLLRHAPFDDGVVLVEAERNRLTRTGSLRALWPRSGPSHWFGGQRRTPLRRPGRPHLPQIVVGDHDPVRRHVERHPRDSAHGKRRTAGTRREGSAVAARAAIGRAERSASQTPAPRRASARLWPRFREVQALVQQRGARAWLRSAAARASRPSRGRHCFGQREGYTANDRLL